MKKIGSEMDDVIKSVVNYIYNDIDNNSVEVKTVVTLENGYITANISESQIEEFVNYNSAKEHCIQTNEGALIKKLNEVNDYLRFLNNNDLTIINIAEWNEYVKLKTQKESK